MKKKLLSILLACILLLCLFSGCGGSGGRSSAPAESPGADAGTAGEGWDEKSATASDADTEQATLPAQSTAKLILTAEISAETKRYAEADSSIRKMTATAGGYIENSSSGGAEGSQWAEYTVRIPQAQFEHFLTQIGDTCNVLSKSQSSENVSQAYFDAEVHIKTLRTKHERLLNLLAKSEKMEDIISLENALGDCEYELEHFETTLRRYDDLIGLSTVRVSLREVADLSVVPQGNSFVSEIRAAAAGGLHGLTIVARTTVIGLVALWPLLLVLTIAGAVTVAILKKRRRPSAPTPKKSDEEDTPGGAK